MRIGIHLGGGGLMMIIALVAVILGVAEVGKVGTAARTVSDSTLPGVIGVKDIALAMHQLRLAEKNHIISVSDELHRQTEHRIALALDRFQEARRRYEMTIDDEAQRREFRKFLGQWESYLKVHRRVLALSGAKTTPGHDRLAQTLSDGEGHELFQLAAEKVKALEAENLRVGRKARDRFYLAYAHARTIMIIAGVAILVTGLLLSLYIAGEKR